MGSFGRHGGLVSFATADANFIKLDIPGIMLGGFGSGAECPDLLLEREFAMDPAMPTSNAIPGA